MLLCFPDRISFMPRKPKLVTVLEKYDVPDLDEDLERMWVVDETHSLRELADEVNVRILRAALRRTKLDLVDGEVENYYRLLQDDSIASGTRIDARRRLERVGIDVDELKEDFVTYQSVRTYMNSVCDITYSKGERSAEERRERVLDQIQTVSGRHESVTESKIRELVSADALEIGAHEVSISTTVFCEECERPFDLDELLRRGSCNCSRP
jgi:hypothetical protein